MTTRQFHAQQQKKVYYKAFVISHPVGTKKYVQGQFYPKTFTLKSGEQVTFDPASMKIDLPSMGEYGTLSMKIDLGRVGTDAKNFVRAIEEYNTATPNKDVTQFSYYEFTDGVEVLAFHMWVKNIIIDGQNVAIIASDDNPSAINVARTYKVEKFPGLAVLS